MSQILRKIKNSIEAKLIVAEVVLLAIALLISQFFEIGKLMTYLTLSILVITLVYSLAKIEFMRFALNKKTVVLATLITSLIGLIIYCMIVYNRNYVYESDHAVYFNQQKELFNLFSLSPIKGCAGVLLSNWVSDYSYFINIILAFPFHFTTHSNNAFVIIYYLFMIVPTCFSMNILLDNIWGSNKFGKKIWIILCNLLFLTFPLLHFASILGMPDIFGLYFVFLILLELINFDFSSTLKFPNISSLLIGILAVGLIITRRWYLFTAIGLLPSFCLAKMGNELLQNRVHSLGKMFINELKLAAYVIVICGVSLFPFIYKTLFIRNYAEEYKAWYMGGLPYELWNQAGFLGILFCLILLVGMIYGFLKKQYRVLTITAIAGFFITIFTYTRIQNMGKHQSLCLIIYYLILAWISLALIAKMKKRVIQIPAVLCFITIMLYNVFSTFQGNEHMQGIFWTTKYILTSLFTWN